MTLEEFKENRFSEEVEKVARNISNWLQNYAHEVVIRVIGKHIRKILADEHTLKLLDELYEREQQEIKDHINSIRNYIENFNIFSQYDLHNHCLTHSSSYRDVLYDLYIREKEEMK